MMGSSPHAPRLLLCIDLSSFTAEHPDCKTTISQRESWEAKAFAERKVRAASICHGCDILFMCTALLVKWAWGAKDLQSIDAFSYCLGCCWKSRNRKTETWQGSRQLPNAKAQPAVTANGLGWVASHRSGLFLIFHFISKVWLQLLCWKFTSLKLQNIAVNLILQSVTNIWDRVLWTVLKIISCQIPRA